MAAPDNEIVVDDPTAPATARRSSPIRARVEIAVYLLLIALGVRAGLRQLETGMGWERDGPQSGYFPFYLSSCWRAPASMVSSSRSYTAQARRANPSSRATSCGA